MQLGMLVSDQFFKLILEKTNKNNLCLHTIQMDLSWDRVINGKPGTLYQHETQTYKQVSEVSIDIVQSGACLYFEAVHVRSDKKVSITLDTKGCIRITT